jgi:acylpyruvate hydrolase
MQVGSIRIGGEATAVRVEGDELVRLPFTTDELFANNMWDVAATDELDGATFERLAFADADWAPIVARPDKIICVGLNYMEHVQEMNHPIPTAPSYFAKYRAALIGAHDDIHLPPPTVSTKVDWEVELCIVIGKRARNVSEADALDYIAGYTVLNDVSVRDWQKRTSQFLAGKTFEHCSPVGPVLTTTDVLGDASGLAVSTTVDGVMKQQSTTDELVFKPAELIADLSTIITLEPGDLIPTGTPSGVGAGRDPQEWLTDGAVMVTHVEGIGELRNRCVLGH